MKRWLKLFTLALVMVPAVFGVMLGGDTDRATSAVYTQYTITDDATGGDCTVIGTWDSATKTCTLTRDLSVPGVNGIKISSSNITLDGAGHYLIGENRLGSGVDTGVYTGIKIVNIEFRNFEYGIYASAADSYLISGNNFSNIRVAIDLTWAGSNTIEENTGSEISMGLLMVTNNGSSIIQNNVFEVLDGGAGIVSYGSSGNNKIMSNKLTGGFYGINIFGSTLNIQNNYISSCSAAGINLSSSAEGLLANNILDSNGVGLAVSTTHDTQIINNYFMQNRDLGLRLFYSSNNLILNNYFLHNGNSSQVDDIVGSGNIYSTATYGGNYWEGNEWPQPCADTNNNGYCDSTYTFTGGQDSLPWVKPGGWGPQLEIDDVESNVYWESYSEYLAGILTHTFKIRNNGKVDASNPYIDSVDSTNAVEQVNPMPVTIAKNLGVGASSETITLKYKVPTGTADFRTYINLVYWDSNGLFYYMGRGGSFYSDNEA
ncbi:MAG: NosD domain-containing protein [Thermoleophilia bacterium]